MPEISIIVPVYNTEKYLHRCIDSILAQTFTDFELILVDDGSPDNCPQICDEYAEKDCRVKVIHQSNSGAATARNCGLDQATGKYIMFCDSDDMVSPLWVSRLVKYVSPDKMVVGKYCSSEEKLGTAVELATESEISLCEYYNFQKVGIAGYICNSIFFTDIIKKNNLYFREQREEGDYNEDLLFVLQYVGHVKSIIYTGYADYYYATHEDSLSRKHTDLYFKKHVEKFKLWHEFLVTHNATADIIHLAENLIYHFLISMTNEVLLAIQDKRYRQHYITFDVMVCSQTVQKCVQYSDCKKENPIIISLIKKRASLRLWILLYLCKLKG